ncbi:MAG: hypothetical protein DRH70_08885, partial [Candidatus Coatesbacteria bacterium]
MVTVALLGLLLGSATAAPRIAIYTDKQSYQPGDTIEVSLAGDNQGEGMSVDVYIGLLTPDGELWAFSPYWGWCWYEVDPWIESIYVPAGFTMNQRPFFWFDLPCYRPVINAAGEFYFLAALSGPDTTDFLGEISVAAFRTGIPQASDYYVDVELGNDANDGSEERPWASITHALNWVEGRQEAPVVIHVAPGTYDRHWPTHELFPLKMKSWVSLVAEGPGTTIDAEEECGTSVISCEDVQGGTIRGFTITGGGPAFSMMGGVKFGGGIFCCDSSVLIADNTIIGNSAGWP